MYTPENKKWEYWNHFVATLNFPTGITAARLKKLKPIIWNNENFWDDIIWRLGGSGIHPHEMEGMHPKTYEQCEGNFWGMLVKIALDRGIL